MSRRGVALIEVLAALVVLGLTGISSVSYLVAVAESQHRALQREAEMERAEEVLSRHALLTYPELAQRIGVRFTDSFAVWVDRPRADLFRVGVAPASRPEAELLAALLFRAETAQRESQE